VVGGSLGAQIFNETIPEVLKALQTQKVKISVWQQTGTKHFGPAKAKFAEYKLDAKVTAFIDDMNAAYTWADLIVCRAGALTVSELAVIGKPAIFVPFPYAVDDHQTQNAREADHAGAAILLKQTDCTVEVLADMLKSLIQDPSRLNRMAEKMKALGRPNATQEIVKICEQFVYPVHG